jgi:hypothetical protein
MAVLRSRRPIPEDSSSDSTSVIALQMVIIHAISWIPRYYIYEPLANARMNGFKTWDEEEAKRFSQTATSLLFFCSSAFFIYQILSPEEWLYSTAGWYSMSNATYLRPDFKFYYLLYIARFSSDLVSIFFESRKKVCRSSGAPYLGSFFAKCFKSHSYRFFS